MLKQSSGHNLAISIHSLLDELPNSTVLVDICLLLPSNHCLPDLYSYTKSPPRKKTASKSQIPLAFEHQDQKSNDEPRLAPFTHLTMLTALTRILDTLPMARIRFIPTETNQDDWENPKLWLERIQQWANMFESTCQTISDTLAELKKGIIWRGQHFSFVIVAPLVISTKIKKNQLLDLIREVFIIYLFFLQNRIFI